MTRTLSATVEQLVATASLFWLLVANRLFFGAALDGRALSQAGTWGYLLALAVGLFCLHFLLLAVLANRWTVKPLLAALIVVSAFASYFMQAFGIYLDPAMVGNVLHTDVAEARELWSWSVLPHLALYAALPLWLLSRVNVVRRPWARALGVRAATLVAATAALVAAVMLVFQPLASLMRNHKEMRYLITPANALWSTGAALASTARSAALPRQPLGEDAHRLRPAATGERPQVLVLVVGETVRAANWGLDGYARQTTPQLAQQSLIPFAPVTACGTNTETSLPCMFAPVGRRDYDEARIRGSESLLHLLARAGVAVHWRDNQAGCKGVCDGLPQDTVRGLNPAGLCQDGRCLDEGLLTGLDARLARAQGTQVLVLHMLGNHGPSYFRRYPPAFARFQPACESDDLRLCSTEQIVNAYDNAVRYTDHVLASLIAKLQAQADRVDSALIFVSDHGESLGEKGLFLHGMPYAIAPDEQTRVPMLMWLSPGWPAGTGLDAACLRRRAAEPGVTHDHLFHTVMGLLGVGSRVYAPAWDLSAGCRQAVATSAAAPQR